MNAIARTLFFFPLFAFHAHGFDQPVFKISHENGYIISGFLDIQYSPLQEPEACHDKTFFCLRSYRIRHYSSVLVTQESREEWFGTDGFYRYIRDIASQHSRIYKIDKSLPELTEALGQHPKADNFNKKLPARFYVREISDHPVEVVHMSIAGNQNIIVHGYWLGKSEKVPVKLEYSLFANKVNDDALSYSMSIDVYIGEARSKKKQKGKKLLAYTESHHQTLPLPFSHLSGRLFEGTQSNQPGFWTKAYNWMATNQYVIYDKLTVLGVYAIYRLVGYINRQPVTLKR